MRLLSLTSARPPQLAKRSERLIRPMCRNVLGCASWAPGQCLQQASKGRAWQSHGARSARCSGRKRERPGGWLCSGLSSTAALLGLCAACPMRVTARPEAHPSSTLQASETDMRILSRDPDREADFNSKIAAVPPSQRPYWNCQSLRRFG